MSNIKFETINDTLCRMVEPEPEPQPAKEPIADCDNCKHRCTKSNIDYCHMYEPRPAYAVGDYVLPINSAAEPYLIVGHLNGDCIVRNLHHPWLADFVAPANQLRKISAKDVKLKFEILGTVSKHPNTDQLFTIHTGDMGEYFTVRMSDIQAIDQPNVKRLLEKQEEEKNV